MSMPSSSSRASSLWPTSSKASVASSPPTSRRTSSPPLNTHQLLACRGGFCGKNLGVCQVALRECNVRVLIDEFAGVVDLVVNH